MLDSSQGGSEKKHEKGSEYSKQPYQSSAKNRQAPQGTRLPLPTTAALLAALLISDFITGCGELCCRDMSFSTSNGIVASSSNSGSSRVSKPVVPGLHGMLCFPNRSLSRLFR